MNVNREDRGSVIGLHEGAMLIQSAKKYGTVEASVWELVQNAIDEDPEHIWVYINRKSQDIFVKDDGNGATVRKLEKAIGLVGATMKKKAGSLGRFGIGVISPLDKCKQFHFISTNKSNVSAYHEWIFVTDVIRKQKVLKRIPVIDRDDLIFSTKKVGTSIHGRVRVNWRTCVHMQTYTSDGVIGKFSMTSIKDGMLERFGPAIRRKKIEISIEIVDLDGKIQVKSFTAKDFTGKKLPEYIFSNNKDVGNVTFNLFVAKSVAGKKRKGKVSLGEIGDEFRVTGVNFLRAATDYINKEAVDALRSGIFEGEILGEKCRLRESRKSFEMNDAFIGLCLAVDAWYKKIGCKAFQDVKERRTETRYQELGQRSLRAVAGLIKDDENFAKLVESFKVGSIGKGHSRPDVKIGKKQNTKAKAVKGVTGATKSSVKKSSFGKKSSNKSIERKGHRPLTVAGPNGQRRARVYNNSLGIQLAHEPLRATTAFWDFDLCNGVLTLNTKHPYWDMCDVSDVKLMKYQEFLIIQAFTLELMPGGDWREHARVYAETLVQPFVYMLLNAGSMTGRRKSKKEPVRVASAS